MTISEYRSEAKSILHEHILLKNDKIKAFVEAEHLFEVVYINVGEKYATAGVKVAPFLRDYLIETRSLYILNSSCPVKDRFLIKQCYNCQKLQHISTNCPEKSKPVCMYCSASHKASNCQHKHNRRKHVCRNCSQSRNLQISSLCNTHHSGSPDCPLIMRAIERIRMNTEITRKN